MQLSYYKDSKGNFGDDLNPWIWYSLYPEIFEEKIRGVFLGIGTLINDRTPANESVYVCGSGTGYHGKPPPDADWNYVFVRGPKTAEYLELPADRAITDPAILVADLLPKRPTRTAMISYMPHHHSTGHANWAEVCKRAGMTYLDPAADIHDTILQISRSKFVIAEAMHAAIVADALRIPWVPVSAYSHILEFKWQDWCESLGLSYQPLELPELWDAEQFLGKKDIFKNRLKNRLVKLGMGSDNWTPPFPNSNYRNTVDSVVDHLIEVRDAPRLFLSKDKDHHEAKQRLVQTMDEFSSRSRRGPMGNPTAGHPSTEVNAEVSRSTPYTTQARTSAALSRPSRALA
jgi:succinoglycan biosynthesis protein ExoV